MGACGRAGNCAGTLCCRTTSSPTTRTRRPSPNRAPTASSIASNAASTNSTRCPLPSPPSRQHQPPPPPERERERSKWTQPVGHLMDIYAVHDVAPLRGKVLVKHEDVVPRHQADVFHSASCQRWNGKQCNVGVSWRDTDGARNECDGQGVVPILGTMIW